METSNFTVTLTPQMMALVPAIAILLQIIKGVPSLKKFQAWFPLLAVAVGVVLAISLKMGASLDEELLAGITMGLATAGGYDVARMQAKSSTGGDAG